MAAPTLDNLSGVLNESIGAFLIAAIVASVLQGINNGQVIFYFKHNKSDPLIMKFLVVFVWAIDVLHLFLVVDAVYIDTVSGRSNPSNLSRESWSDMAIVIVSAVSDFGVKGTFSYRVWRLNHQWILSAFIMSSAFVTFGFSLFLLIQMIMAPAAPPSRVGTLGSLITLAMSDIIMSVVLAIVFWRRRSIFPTVNRVLRLIILYTMETSLVTSVGATAGLIMYATLPEAPIFEAVLWVLPHLILSSLLVALNAREGLRQRQMSAIILSPINRASWHRSFDPGRSVESGL